METFLTSSQYPEPFEVSTISMCLSKSKLSKSDAKSGEKPKGTRKYSVSGNNFEQHLTDRYVNPPPSRTQKPENWDHFLGSLAKPRPSLPPSPSSNGPDDSFLQAVEDVKTEPQVMSQVFPKIVGSKRLPSGENLVLGNLDPLTDGSLVDVQPDYYEGSRPGPPDRRIRARARRFFVPSTHEDAPFLPNFFGEAKTSAGKFAVARRQACYDGALGARGVHHLQSLGKEETYHKNAGTTSAIYRGGGSLKMYAHHLSQPRGPGTSQHYHMTPLGGWDLTGSPETFRQGVSAFKNVRELVAKHREKLIEEANRRMK